MHLPNFRKLAHYLYETVRPFWHWAPGYRPNYLYEWGPFAWGNVRSEVTAPRTSTVIGPAWHNGRFHLMWGESAGSLSLEWQIPSRRRFLLKLQLGGAEGETIGGAVACGLFAFWWTFDLRGLTLWRHPQPLDRLARWLGCNGRDWEVRWNDGCLWWHWGADAWNDGYGRKGVIHVVDRLAGRSQLTTHELKTVTGLIPLPEGATPARFTFTLRTHRRARWPFVQRVVMCNIQPQRPAVVPGKGENAWDLDDDTVFEMSCRATTVEEAVAAYVETVFRDRRRYGGSVAWQPAESEAR
jgi:hypothetical protein